MTVTKEIVEQRLKDYNDSFDQYRKALDNQLNVAKHINGKFKSNDFLPVKEKDIIKERTILENIYLDSITEKTDNVNHPNHYTQGKIECIDALESMVSSYTDPNAAVLSWQICKYIWRHPFKNNPHEDLMKAKFYLERLIKHYEDNIKVEE